MSHPLDGLAYQLQPMSDAQGLVVPAALLHPFLGICPDLDVMVNVPSSANSRELANDFHSACTHLLGITLPGSK